MTHFGPVGGFNYSTRLMLVHGQESPLSKAITTAYEMIPESTRELMLFCWAGRQSISAFGNYLAYPSIDRSLATDILDQDFGESFEDLRLEATAYTNDLFND